MTDQPTSCPRRILLLAGQADAVAQWKPLLAPEAEIRVVSSLAEGESILGSEEFDGLFCPRSELLPVLVDARRDHARAILNGITQGVCSVAPNGELVWANAVLQRYSPEVLDAIRNASSELGAELAADPERRPRQRHVHVPPQHFDLTVSALADAGGTINRFVGLVSDTTALARMQERLHLIDAAGRELVALESDDAAGLEVPERLQLLEDRLIGYCRDLLHFTHFAVLVIDPSSGRLDPVLMGGFSERMRTIRIFARREGNGICGFVAATGETYLCPDVAKDPLYLPGLECAVSSLTVPLRLNDRIVGVLNVESDQPAAFNDEDRQVAEVFGRYIATALQMLKLLAVERSETTGQLAADVRAELSAPLNDIVAEATLLLQGAGSDAAQQRLRTILARVEHVQHTLQSLVEAPAVRGLTVAADAGNPALRGRRVLVADDEDIIRETIADVLTKAGAAPVTARDGEEAVTLLRAQPCDLVLSDIKMPLRNGYEVFAAAKEVNPRTPVILITGFGYDPEHSIVRASREGLAGVLFKPFKVEQLMELIGKALAAGGGE